MTDNGMDDFRIDGGLATVPITDSDVTSYISSLTRERSAVLRRLEKEAQEEAIPIIQLAGASLLRLLCALHRPRRILEIGTAIGYSAIHLAEAAREARIGTIEIDEARAEEARRQAELAAAQARDAYASSEFARAQRLLQGNAIARRDFEEKRNAAAEARAAVQAARAALAAAQLDLEHTRIVAPVSGRISRANVTEGNVVAAGAQAGPLTTLVSVDRMYAAFDVDEQSYLAFVSQAVAQGKGESVPVLLGLADEDGYPRRGRVSDVDNRLDTSSGTIRVRAVFDNDDGKLLPGLYARVRLGGGAPRPAVLIDEKAIGTDQDKRYVLVLEDGKVAYREVRLGAAHDGLRVVESGLRPGERIVVNGMQRVRPGEAVTARAVPMQAPAVLAARG